MEERTEPFGSAEKAGSQDLVPVCTNVGVDLAWSAYDLFVTDRLSCFCVAKLCDFLENLSTRFSSGCADVCFLHTGLQYRFAWILMPIKKGFKKRSGPCSQRFYWFHVPSKFSKLIVQYAKCYDLYTCIGNGVPGAGSRPEGGFSTSTFKIHLVMEHERDLDFYGAQCPKLFFDRLPTEVKEGTNLPSMSIALELQFPLYYGFKMEYKGEIIRLSEVVNMMQAHLPLEKDPLAEVIATSSNASCFENPVVEASEVDISKFEIKPEAQGWYEAPATASNLTSQRLSGKERMMKFQQLLHIAMAFAELDHGPFFDKRVCPVPLGNISGPGVLIECPRCCTPRKATTPTSFLNLLNHLQRNHPQSLGRLVENVQERYGPYIKFMQKKVGMINLWQGKRKLGVL